MFRTILADQDGLYDPTDHNDRLLLGLTGIMSEAELHVLRGRMRQGLLNKVRRGEVFLEPPVGYVRSPKGGYELDPDEQVVDARWRAESSINMLWVRFSLRCSRAHLN